MVGNKNISSDWKKTELKNILSVRHGKSQKEIECINGKYPILGTGGQIGQTNSYLYDKPSVLIGRKGTINVPQFVTSPFWTIDTLFYTDIKENYNPKYIYYMFQNIDWYLYNEASGVPSLSAKTIENINVIVPKLKLEQDVIASALSDIDNLIIVLKKLINKKKLINQGIKSELLAGKRRLEGFNDEWVEITLGNIVQFINGKAHENSLDEYGKYTVVNSKFISTSGEVKKYSNNPYCIAQEGDILMVMSDVPNGRAIAKCYLVEENDKYTVNQRVCIIRANDCIGKYLYYRLDKNKYYLSFDDGVKQTNLRKDDVLGLKLKIPKLDEQKAIANILSDMDNEIEQLNIKLNKYKNIKNGMMEELLTGKRRLV